MQPTPDNPNPMGGQYNPYAAPSAGAEMQGFGYQPQEIQVLASRGTRLGARILDNLLALASAIPFGVALMIQVNSISSSYEPDPLGYSPPPDPAAEMFSPLVLLMILPILALQFYQWYLISRDGQTLAKRWLGIQIVKQMGGPVDFVSGVILREWVVGFLGALPYIGSCVGFIDAVMIFGDEQLCLHDHIAKTKVIAKLNQI